MILLVVAFAAHPSRRCLAPTSPFVSHISSVVARYRFISHLTSPAFNLTHLRCPLIFHPCADSPKQTKTSFPLYPFNVGCDVSKGPWHLLGPFWCSFSPLFPHSLGRLYILEIYSKPFWSARSITFIWETSTPQTIVSKQQGFTKGVPQIYFVFPRFTMARAIGKELFFDWALRNTMLPLGKTSSSNSLDCCWYSWSSSLIAPT